MLAPRPQAAAASKACAHSRLGASPTGGALGCDSNQAANTLHAFIHWPALRAAVEGRCLQCWQLEPVACCRPQEVRALRSSGHHTRRSRVGAFRLTPQGPAFGPQGAGWGMGQWLEQRPGGGAGGPGGGTKARSLGGSVAWWQVVRCLLELCGWPGLEVGRLGPNMAAQLPRCGGRPMCLRAVVELWRLPEWGEALAGRQLSSWRWRISLVQWEERQAASRRGRGA
jgi:hypothetical protein